LIFNNSFINIAPSNYLYEAFYKNGYTNLVYIPNTIELQNYPFIKREVIVPKLLWVRSFSKIYNPIMAIKVLVELKKQYPNATLCMIGPKKDESYIASVRFAKKNKVEVNFTGKLSKFEWINLSNSSNIFLNTTHFDNTPISVIEAMALGIPVVSTKVGGIPFLLEHEKNALLVSDNDVEDMTTQIKKLLKNPEQTNIIVENARETVNNFDWEIVKLKWIELLKVHNK
jgi:glycosyltransferase involved in cell wall biosynthesis